MELLQIFFIIYPTRGTAGLTFALPFCTKPLTTWVFCAEQ